MTNISLNKTPKYVGFCGYAGVGKDTFGDIYYNYLIRYFNVAKEALADNVKKDLQTFIFEQYNFDIFTCSREQKELVRDLLVFYAEKRRKEDPDYWIKRLNNSIKYGNYDSVIITDIRYQNEVEWIHDNGGIVIMIDRIGVGPANETEARTVSEAREIVDYIIHVPEVLNLEELDGYLFKLDIFNVA